MADTHALPRLLDDFVWSLRRQGLVVAPPQVIDLQRAIRALGWDDRAAVLDATAAMVLKRAADEPRLQAAFAEFFARERPAENLWERLRSDGFTDAELDALRDLLEVIHDGPDAGSTSSFTALLEGGAEMDRLLQLAGFHREVDGLRSPLQAGFFTQRAMGALGIREARARLGALRQHLRGALGERGDLLADALARQLDAASSTLRDHIQRSARRAEDELSRVGRRRDDFPFTSLRDAELDDVCRAVRSFADRLRGAERVRTRRGQKGRIDPGRTIRALLRTGGVPFRPVRRERRRDKPRLVLLCDVSDSVRAPSRFMLELVHAAHELFDRTRSFVFVSDVGETTLLFEREPARVALAAAYGGAVIPVTDNSNYGRVFRAFEARHLASVDRRTTVVILGDGRTNYHDASEATLSRIRARARALYWFCTEPRAGWTTGDSAMRLYAPECTDVLQVTTARELEEAARTLVWKR